MRTAATPGTSSAMRPASSRSAVARTLPVKVTVLPCAVISMPERWKASSSYSTRRVRSVEAFAGPDVPARPETGERGDDHGVVQSGFGDLLRGVHLVGGHHRTGQIHQAALDGDPYVGAREARLDPDGAVDQDLGVEVREPLLKLFNLGIGRALGLDVGLRRGPSVPSVAPMSSARLTTTAMV